MTKIEIYSASAQSNDGSAAKGTSSNPYTVAEYESMLDNGTWTGGYVENMGYCLKEVVVTASYPDSDSMDSDDSWPSDDFWPSDGSSPFENGTNPSGGSGTESNTSGGGSNGNGNSGNGESHSGSNNSPTGYSISKAVTYLVAHAYSSYNDKCGHCARAVREALEAGGLSTVGHPKSACDYDTFLPQIGFHQVNKNNYSPQKGDIIVLEAVKDHSHGHIAMYSGSKWISDFVQRDMWGGSVYRNMAEYTIFRR